MSTRTGHIFQRRRLDEVRHCPYAVCDGAAHLTRGTPTERDMMTEQQIKDAARELVEAEGTDPEYLSVVEMWPDATDDECDRIYDMAHAASVRLP